MKIAYVVDWDATIGGGVLAKVVAQTGNWLRLGHDAKLYVLSPQAKEGRTISDEALVSYSNVIEYKKLKFVPDKIGKIKALLHLNQKILEFKPDLVYYRDASWTPGIIWILKKFKYLVVEINSINDQKIAKAKFCKIFYSRLFKNSIYSKSDGFIFVTKELTSSINTFNKPYKIIANGYDVDCKSCSSDVKKYNRPQLILVVSNDASWHGIDEFALLSSAIPEFDFHLYGVTHTTSLSNLYIHGRASNAELVDVYKEMDIGVGTLALYKKGMNEACPLKVREYVANGLPVIGAYHDTDLSDQDFFLQIDNVKSSVIKNVDNIRKFVHKWHGKRVPSKVADNLIGNLTKEKERLNFFSKLIAK